MPKKTSDKSHDHRYRPYPQFFLRLPEAATAEDELCEMMGQLSIKDTEEDFCDHFNRLSIGPSV